MTHLVARSEFGPGLVRAAVDFLSFPYLEAGAEASPRAVPCVHETVGRHQLVTDTVLVAHRTHTQIDSRGIEAHDHLFVKESAID